MIAGLWLDGVFGGVVTACFYSLIHEAVECAEVICVALLELPMGH
jgi:hypothetical protein